MTRKETCALLAAFVDKAARTPDGPDMEKLIDTYATQWSKAEASGGDTAHMRLRLLVGFWRKHPKKTQAAIQVVIRKYYWQGIPLQLQRKYAHVHDALIDDTLRRLGISDEKFYDPGYLRDAIGRLARMSVRGEKLHE